MGNPYQGEVDFELGGKTHTLRYGVNEHIAVQAALGIEDDAEYWDIIGTRLSISLRALRTIALHGLRATEPELTEIEAGNYLTELGTYEMVRLVSEALVWSLPNRGKEAGAADKKGGKARPSGGPTST